LYYTHSKGDRLVLEACRAQLDKVRGEIPVVAVSLAPLNWPKENGENIILPLAPSILTMFKQQLAGLQTLTTDVVFCCEHDVLYHPSHFEFTPPKPDIYYFNLNVWAVDVTDGKALHYDGMKMTSGLVAHRDILIEHYTKKIAWVEEVGKFHHNMMGFEPGKKVSKGRLGDYEWETWRSPFPNIDIKGDWNLTRKRFKLEDYRNRRHMTKSWTLTDTVPGWGVTKGRFKEMLEGIVA
jgi:hypothetical protein